MSEPRLPPLPREKWDDDVEAALRAGVPDSIGDKFMSTGDDAMRVPNGISSLMYHPRLAGKFLAFNALLLRDQVLPGRQGRERGGTGGEGRGEGRGGGGGA